MKYMFVLLMLALIPKEVLAMGECHEGAARTQAIQEIEYLKRWYAKATDKIGEGSEAAIGEGRAVYHRIFDQKAVIRAGGDFEDQIGPDGWVDVVLGALGPLGPTQHLIGTQLVEIEALELDDDCNVVAGSATMESYLQAWHERKDEKVWLFLGTYYDKIQFNPGKGWQIVDMSLVQVAGETRYMDEAVGKAGD